MASSRKRKILLLVGILVRMVLGGVFIFASWSKIVHPAEFARMVANYQILPSTLINPTALFLPWLEMVCGICLLIGWITRGSAIIISGLLALFMAALGYSLYRGLDIQCGCFSLNSQQAVPLYFDIFRDMVLLAMAVWTLWRPRGIARVSMDDYAHK
jgi:uncharacterized membrane protein YphA (DoxX/SURF4 family)